MATALWLRRALGSSLAAGTLMLGSAAPVRADIVTFVGACTFHLRLSFNPSADQSLSATSITFTASGACVVNDVVTTGTLHGTASSTPLAGWTCAAGMATGSGSFDTNYPGMDAQPVAVVLAAAGPTLTMALHSVPVYTGAAAFVQQPASATACAAGQPVATAAYDGVLAFEDPIVSP